MLTIVCSFTWPDGARAQAVLAVPAPENFDPILYSGEYERLPRQERASAAGFDLWAAEAAAACGAKLTVLRSGQFDVWAR